MSGIKDNHEKPVIIEAESIEQAQFKIYVAPINRKRMSDHLQLQLEKKHHIITKVTDKYHEIKSKTTPEAIKEKVKQVYQKNSVYKLAQLTKARLEGKTTPKKLESIIIELNKNLEKTDKLHAIIGKAITKHRQHSSHKGSDIDLGYLSRLLINKVSKILLSSKASKAQQLKVLGEVKGIIHIIKEHLEEDMSIYLSIDKNQSLGDKKLLSSITKKIENLIDLQKSLVHEVHELHKTHKDSFHRAS